MRSCHSTRLVQLVGQPPGDDRGRDRAGEPPGGRDRAQAQQLSSVSSLEQNNDVLCDH